MNRNNILLENRLIFKNLSSPETLEVVNPEGLSKTSDDMFLEESMKGAKTIDSKIDWLDRFIQDKLGKNGSMGSLGSMATGAGIGAYLAAESALVATGVGIAALPVIYLASKGIQRIKDSQVLDQKLDPTISKMETGVSLRQDTIEKAGAWNAIKKFVGAESKISIETYARIVEHDIIVDDLIRSREELHAKKLAQQEAIKKIRRGWGTRAKGWVTDKFESDEEQKNFNKTKAALEREKERIAKRREKLEEEINKTKDRFEEKTAEYTEQVEQSIDAMQSIIGQEVMDKKEWESHILLDPKDMPGSFDVNGVEYETLDEFISNYPDFDSSVRAALRSSLKESRRLLRKKQKIGRKFGAENFDKFTQKSAAEYVSEKRSVVSKLDNLSRKVGHSVTLTSIPRELTEKFRNMTAPLSGVVKSSNKDLVTIVIKNKTGEEFTLELPLRFNLRTVKDFSISVESSGIKKTEKFPVSLLSSMGIKIEDINVDDSIVNMQKALIPLISEGADYSKFELGLSKVLMDIFRKKFGFPDMNKLKTFKISKKSEAKSGGQIILECYPSGAGNPGLEVEIPLSSATEIDKNKKIKLRKVETGRSITSPLLEEEMTYSDFLRSNVLPKVETEKKYQDFVALKNYIEDDKNNDTYIVPRDVPDAVAQGYFVATSGGAFNINNLQNLKIENKSPDLILSGLEFNITIPKNAKADDDITVELRDASSTKVTIKAIDLVDFDLHQV